MTEKKETRYDLDGYDSVTDVVDDLLSRYPGLDGDEEIEYSKLEESSGFSWYPIGDPVIEDERMSITDHVTQKCVFTFGIIYRAHFRTADQKKAATEMLDNIGRWLERQEVILDGKSHRLGGYPQLSGARRIERISRKTRAYLDNIQESGCEDWAIVIVVRYTNEYDR